MDSTAEKMYLENIEEFVLDENKIVTYKWLSKTLDLHVNTAKQLLYKYVQQKKADVHITYLIGGMLADCSGGKIVIVRESELESVKVQFKFITSEHIYSVQKASQLKDLNILFGVDHPADKSNSDRQGVISCKNAIKRVANEMSNLRIAAFKPVESSKPPPQKKSDPSVDPPKSNNNDDSKNIAVNETKSESDSVKPKTIASMFTAQTKKNTTVKTPNIASKNNKGGIGAFFTKLPEKLKVGEKTAVSDKQLKIPTNNFVAPDKEIKSENHIKTEGDKGKSGINVNGDKPSKQESPTLKETKKNVVSDKGSGKSNKSTNGKKKKRSSDKGQKPAKKRKRIMVMSDSDDASIDDIFGKEDSSDEELRPPSPEMLPEASKYKQSQSSDEDIIPATPVVQPEQNGRRRSRKRKMVDKTFTDEEGFITTKKEYVFESCSEDEDVQIDSKENTVVGTVKTVDENKKVDDDEEVSPPNKKTSKKKKQADEKKKVDEDEEVSPPNKKTSKKKKQAAVKKEVSVAPKPKQQSIMSFFSSKN